MTQFLSLIGWTFLPSLVSGWIQSLYYTIVLPAGARKPRPGTPLHARHRRIIQITIIGLYLLYTIFEADHDIRQDSHYYADLSLPLTASDRDVKSRFRRLAAVHHPDKAGTGVNHDWFIHLKAAADTLQDGPKRFAYERFGPTVNSWQKCSTIRDYISRGVFQNTLPHYTIAAATVYVFGLLGYMNFAKFYRWIILITLLTFEVHLVTRPNPPAFVAAINTVLTTFTSHPPYLPFQAITLARKLTITIYVAIAQIGPLLKTHLNPDAEQKQQDEQKALDEGLDKLTMMAAGLDHEGGRLVDMELMPFKGHEQGAARLKGKMREWLVQNTIRGDPMVKDALNGSIKKRRVGASSSKEQVEQ